MSTPLSSRTRAAIRKSRRIIPALVIAPVILGVMTVMPAAHASVGCHDAGCNGQDPVGEGCSADAQFVDSFHYQYPDGKYYEIDLRYSPACNANWARAVADTSVPFCVKDADGAVESYTTAPGRVASWTNMVDGSSPGDIAFLQLPFPTQSQNFDAIYANDTPAANFTQNYPC